MVGRRQKEDSREKLEIHTPWAKSSLKVNKTT
jgi:hypothetical protein